MAKDVLQVEGIVVEGYPDAKFKVEVKLPGKGDVEESGNTHIIIAHVSGKMRKNFIRILPGDTVLVEVSPYDLTKGRIVFREK
ncbi:MAG: translation initiation factor IF-1 [Candidatus Gracilibacteria bacterium]|nr:translation initiation factor IF-1 [Candidatus Gracilibacteria bacterium]